MRTEAVRGLIRESEHHGITGDPNEWLEGEYEFNADLCQPGREAESPALAELQLALAEIRADTAHTLI